MSRVVIVGQGYVGLPLALAAVGAGFDVVGFEIDEARVAHLRRGESYISDLSDAQIASALETGRYNPSTDPADLDGFDVAVISVPTPLRDGAPDLTFMESAAAALGAALGRGATVVLESTTYPGTTEELLVPVLEAATGLKAGADFHVGYSPERINPGDAVHRLENTPKVVAGIDDASAEAISSFYETFINEVVVVSSPAVAEMTKLLENTFRHVNIALVNELAMFANDLDIDLWEAIEAASTKPFGYMRFTPGPGVGGHCLPVDPSYLSWQVERSLGETFRFVELANDVNSHMPDYVVRRIVASLNDRSLAVRGQRILLLGLAYKPNTGDCRESPARDVAEQLLQMGAEVAVADSWVDPSEMPTGVDIVEPSAHEASQATLTVLLVDHGGIDYEAIAEAAPAVFDCRHRLTGDRVEHL